MKQAGTCELKAEEIVPKEAFMSHVSLQSLVGCARESAGICTGSARSLYGCCVLFGCFALRDDKVHVCVDCEADDFLVERLGQTTGLEVEAEESL